MSIIHVRALELNLCSYGDSISNYQICKRRKNARKLKLEKYRITKCLKLDKDIQEVSGNKFNVLGNS